MTFTDLGQGRAIVFSHGSMMDQEMFAPQIECFSNEFRVISFDHRARTENWRGPYSLYDLADDCRELLDRLGVQQCVLAGMSMGGCMALRFALGRSAQVDALILIGTWGSPYSEDEKARWSAHYARLRGYDRLPTTFIGEEAALCFGQAARQERPGLIESWKRKWESCSGEALYFETQSWIQQDDIRSRLSEIDIPVLVIHGEEDQAVPISEAELLCSDLPNARLVVIPAAGHTVNLEQPDRVNEAISEFLLGAASPGGALTGLNTGSKGRGG